MNFEQNQARLELIEQGLAPALPPFHMGERLYQHEPHIPLLPHHPPPPPPQFMTYDEIDRMNEMEDIQDEAWAVEGDLGRMLTWQDLVDDGYHLYKFTSGRTFKLRGYYSNKLVDFYMHIFYAYPEELRNGLVAYNPEVHHQQTFLYEAQLRLLERRIAEEQAPQNMAQGMN